MISLGEIIFQRDNQFLLRNHQEIEKLLQVIDQIYIDFKKQIELFIKIWIISFIICFVDVFPLLLSLEAENYINNSNYVY